MKLENETAKRRLAAILAADVAGYTRLMEADEEGTLNAWWAARKNIIDPAISEHNGRIVKHTGDGFLAEFPTAVSAVRCASAMQAALADSNRGVETQRRFDFRMGINIGDIVVDDEDIYGDGVNISARLESLADPGGICISTAVYEQVKNRLDFEFRDMGTKKLKHISDPVRYYQFSPEAVSSGTNINKVLASCFSTLRQAVTPLRLVLGIVAIIAIGIFLTDGSPRQTSHEKKSPVIAVLPFSIIGEGETQKSFGEGLNEELIVALSSIQGLRVISLGGNDQADGAVIQTAQYRFEGSVRSEAGRIGVSAKLVESETGFYLWGGRYDRKLTDILRVQNEVAEKIVATLAERLQQSEEERHESELTPAGLVVDIFYRGFAQIGRFAKSAAFLPQDFIDWVSGNENLELSEINLNWMAT